MEKETVIEAPLDKVLVSPRNTRQPKETDPDVVELAASIMARGQITPGIARPYPKKPGFYELAAGARRRTACSAAGKPTVKIIVREMTDEDLDEIILVENFQRLDPDPRAEAEVVSRLVANGKRTPAQIAAACGRDEKWATRRLKLLTIEPKLLALWKTGQDFDHFTVEMMEFLGSLPAALQQEIAKDHWQYRRYSSRKELEASFSQQLCRLDTFNLEDPRTFVENCGPGCASDSRQEGSLFDFNTPGKGKKKADCGRCLNTGCFMARLAKFRAAEVERLSEGEKAPIFTEGWLNEIKIGDTNVRPRNDDHILSTKPTEGSTRAILIKRDLKMVVRYIPASAKPSGNNTGGVAKSAAVKHQERSALLQSKRWLIVREQLVTTLQAAELGDLTMDVVDLVAGIGLPYGLRSDRYHANTKVWNILEHRLAGYPSDRSPSYYGDEDEPETLVPRNVLLWNSARELLLALIPEPAKISDAINYVPNLEGIAGLIKFPIDSKKREADLQVLPPKSWGPTDPHTLEPIKPAAAAPKAAAKKSAKPKAKASTGTQWIDVGDIGKRKKGKKRALATA